MAKAVIYSDEDVLAAQQALRTKTARKVGKTRSQVAEFLADDIRRAIEQGYSLQEIKKILADAGISVSIAKMQAILNGQGEKTKEGNTAVSDNLSRASSELSGDEPASNKGNCENLL